VYYTVEEENLICELRSALKPETRAELIAYLEFFALRSESEMREIAESAIERTRKMSDAAFADYSFCPTVQ
jgi:hypothetical protein